MANCSDITKFGIFDVSKTSREEDLVSSYLKWLSSQEANSREEASNSSLSLGIPIPDLPLDFGGEHAAGNTTSWSKKVAEYLKNDGEARTRFNQEFLAANSNIVAAWRDCALNKKGLVCWAEQTENPKEILLKIDLRPLVLPMLSVPKIVKIAASAHVETDEDFVGQPLAAETYSIIYKRTGNNWREAVNFVVTTSDPNYRDSCNVAEVDGVVSIANPKGLIAFWKGNGNANDGLGKYHGIASHGVAYAAGHRRKAFKFDGENGIVATPLVVSYERGATFDAWIKTADDSGMIMTDGGGASGEKGMGLFVEPGGYLKLFGSKGTAADFNFVLDAGIKINDDKFHHIAATWTGDATENGVVLYVDGRSRVVFGTAKEAVAKGSTPLYLGRHNTLGYFPYAGLIDEAKVFDRVLTPDEIEKLSRS